MGGVVLGDTHSRPPSEQARSPRMGHISPRKALYRPIFGPLWGYFGSFGCVVGRLRAPPLPRRRLMGGHALHPYEDPYGLTRQPLWGNYRASLDYALTHMDS